MTDDELRKQYEAMQEAIRNRRQQEQTVKPILTNSTDTPRNEDGSLPDEINVLCGVPVSMCKAAEQAAEIAAMTVELFLAGQEKKQDAPMEALLTAVVQLGKFRKLQRVLKEMIDDAEKAQAEATQKLAVARAQESARKES